MITRDQQRGLLAGSYLFSSLKERELDDLLDLAVHRKADAGQVIFTRGSASESIYAVLSGLVKVVSQSAEGKELILRFINPGEVFGEIGVLDGRERTATMVADHASELLVLKRSSLLRLLERSPKLALKILSAVASRLRSTTALLEDVLFLNVPARLARKLLDLAETYGCAEERGVRIDLRLPQEVIGNLIGTSRVSVNQQMQAWKKRGLIDVTNSYITLLESTELEQIASGASE